MRDELGQRTFLYVIVDAKLQAAVDKEEFPSLESEVESARAKYSGAREDLIRHYQEHHPDLRADQATG